MKLSQRAAAMKPSATLAVSGKAKQMKAEGIDVVDFSAGEPDFDTPKRICDAAISAINAGYTRYTLTPGVIPLREAIVRKFARDYGFEITTDQIVVSCGAKHSLYNAFAALIDAGDEVIIPSPYWVSYPPQVKLFGGVPVFVETTAENNFKLNCEQLKSAITDKTKLLVINSPSNPTGQLYSKSEFEALAEVILENDLMVICDDIYEKLIYDGQKFISMSQVSEEIRQRCIVINGVSKSSAMTGWRIGYMVADQKLCAAISRLQGQMTSNPSSIAQYAALEAIDGEASELPNWIAKFEKRRNRIVELLNDIDGVKCSKPGGAFYAFADINALLGLKHGEKTLETDLDFADYLLTKEKIATVPGSPFGAEGFLRFSFATSIEIIEDGMNRMKKAIAEII